MTDPKGGELPSLTSDSQAADPSVSSAGYPRAPTWAWYLELDATVNGNLADTPERARKHGFIFTKGLPGQNPNTE
jgi:hypothetical protein